MTHTLLRQKLVNALEKVEQHKGIEQEKKGIWVNRFRCDGKTITNDLLDTFYSLYLSGD